MNWKPKFIHLPIDKMAGAPWNLIDYRGFRIALCGTDGNHEKDGELIANDLLNIIAIGEASGELLDTAAKKFETQQKQIEELEGALREAIDEGGLYLSGKGDKIGSFRDHGFRRADEVPHLAAWLKKQEVQNEG